MVSNWFKLKKKHYYSSTTIEDKTAVGQRSNSAQDQLGAKTTSLRVK